LHKSATATIDTIGCCLTVPWRLIALGNSSAPDTQRRCSPQATQPTSARQQIAKKKKFRQSKKTGLQNSIMVGRRRNMALEDRSECIDRRDHIA